VPHVKVDSRGAAGVSSEASHVADAEASSSSGPIKDETKLYDLENGARGLKKVGIWLPIIGEVEIAIKKRNTGRGSANAAAREGSRLA
jgi:hypothetical protein